MIWFFLSKISNTFNLIIDLLFDLLNSFQNYAYIICIYSVVNWFFFLLRSTKSHSDFLCSV